MNILEMGNIRTKKGIMITREERVKREGSPYYTWTPGAIATTASSEIYLPTQFPASRKYEPLDFIEVVNNEAANNLTLTINNGDALPVPAGTIRTVSRQGLWTITITNNGALTTTAGLVIVTLRKEPLTIDKWARGKRL